MLALSTGVEKLSRHMHMGEWPRVDPGMERLSGDLRRTTIRNKILGVVGLGRIGLAVAKRAQGLGMRILYYDPYPSKEAERLGMQRVLLLSDLLNRSDFVACQARTKDCLFNDESFA